MTFKHTCPSCKAKDKVIEKCKHCLKYCCSECSVNGECYDCFIIANDQSEVLRYFEEKKQALEYEV